MSRLELLAITGKIENTRSRAIPQQRDLRPLGPLSGQGADGGARTRDRWVPADLRADSLATVPPTPPSLLSSEISKYYTESPQQAIKNPAQSNETAFTKDRKYQKLTQRCFRHLIPASPGCHQPQITWRTLSVLSGPNVYRSVRFWPLRAVNAFLRPSNGGGLTAQLHDGT
ncbi:hypothetical protein PoB_001532400 [Plakobranchus ocellatus]|uniref:Uncharacterized protein n=1 Tax=Plakobranchus ocellatus TaxID=259542 RepID=A0AAV3Z349_9GAST|nr:hypothetical protein PoB_001532400 [Plakobranchus ocellatus]